MNLYLVSTTPDADGAPAPPTRIIVDVCGGCVTSIYGDRLPAGVEIECVVRDYDSIEEGSPDPVDKNYMPEAHYWG